jgi:hypothetical protein
MRTFVISDSHGHPEIIRFALDHGGFDPGRDRFVFGGDFLDRGTDAQGCLDLIERYADEVLLGNHDLAVLLDTPVWPQEPDSPGFRPLLIDKVLDQEPAHAWKAVVSVEGVLVSHAGISARYERVFREICGGEPAVFAQRMNEEFRAAARLWLGSGGQAWDRNTGDEGCSGAERHSDEDAADPAGMFGDYGPFWFRPPPFTHARPLAGVTQMAGHTPAMAELAKDGFYMIDPGVWLADFGEPLQFRYAVIEDGRVTVVEGDMSEAARPRRGEELPPTAPWA